MKKPYKRKPRGGTIGQPAKITDLEMLKRSMRWRPSLADVATLFACGVRTVQDTIRREFDMTFEEFRDMHMAETRRQLVEKALEMALDKVEPSERMLIHCLNNLCGWNSGNANSTVVQVKAEANVLSESDKKMVQEFKETFVGYLGERKEPA